MNSHGADPQVVLFSTQIYHKLLAAYPSPFRHEYGPHMAQVFRDCCLRAYRNDGLPGTLMLWGITLLDYLKSLVEEHLQKGVHMTKTRFIQMSGWAFILGGIAVVLGFTAGQLKGADEYNPYNALSSPIDPIYEVGQLILIPASFVLITVGIIGLFLRYGERSGGFGKTGLGVGIAGGGLGFVTLLVSYIVEYDFLWGFLVVSMLMLFGGIMIFGFASLKKRLLPRWNSLPIFAGVAIPLLFLVSTIYETFTGNWFEIPWIDFPLFMITAVGLILLGYLLQSDAQGEPLPSA